MLYFNEKDWQDIKDKYTKEEIIDRLSDMIIDGKITMPLTNISLDEAILALKELATIDTSLKEGEFTTRYEENHSNSIKYIRRVYEPSSK